MINTLILGKNRRKEGDFSGRSMISPTISNKTETEKEFFDSLKQGCLLRDSLVFLYSVTDPLRSSVPSAPHPAGH